MKSEQVTSIPVSKFPRSERHLGLGDGDVSGSAALVALDGQDLVVVRAQVQAGLRPGVKVVLDGDGAADAVVAADGPVLVEGGGALDAGLVDALGLVDVVCVAVGGDRGDLGGYFSCLSVPFAWFIVGTCLLKLTSRAGVVVAEALDNVVLDQGAGRPAVDGDVAVDVGGGPCAAVLDGAVAASLPALASDKVVAVCPVDAELARSLVVVCHGAVAAGVVEGVEEAVVGAGARWGRAVHELLEGGCTVNGGGGDGASGSHQGEE